MDILDFKDDLDKKNNGVKKFLDADKETWILVAAYGTPQFWETRDKFYKQLNKDELSTEDHADVLAKTYAEAVLLDWCLTEDGKNVPYSKEKAIEWLSNPALSRFFEIVDLHAKSVENFRYKKQQDEKKP